MTEHIVKFAFIKFFRKSHKLIVQRGLSPPDIYGLV